ncbi:hypothetical protein B0I35DRAFT_437593 [Stachybotrys elegans]|uniref:Uncharacterized protein n=1 Tax=Stachybotrys elegans TaxID=80388 RepID=A0A8K0SR66_9HYPO|nr:hypothetical protein B0I35DRAFT_437593 [Stachybotrys elegans]
MSVPAAFARASSPSRSALRRVFLTISFLSSHLIPRRADATSNLSAPFLSPFLLLRFLFPAHRKYTPQSNLWCMHRATMASVSPFTWANGQTPPQVRPPTNSFIVFFPTSNTDNSRATTAGNNTAGTAPHYLSWNKQLAIPRFASVPRWDCPRKRPCAKDAIVKRVHKPRTIAQGFKPSIVFNFEKSDEDEPKPRRRKIGEHTEAHLGPDVPTPVQGPESTAKVAALKLEALVNVANCMLRDYTWASLQDIQDQRSGKQCKTVPIEQLNTGNSLITYLQIMPILDKAASLGESPIDTRHAAAALSSAILQDIRRDPRQNLAQYGATELSPIVERTELDLSAPATPTSATRRRITDNKVELPPGPSPKASPSPTKSASPPQRSPGRTYALPAFDTLSPPVEEEPPSSPIRARSARVSFAASSPADPFKDERATPPAAMHRPVAPTPSRWKNGEEPATPVPATPATYVVDHATPMGLVASIPTGTPRPCRSPIVDASMADPDFLFGGNVTFESNETRPSWLSPKLSGSIFTKSSKSPKRRDSEPLVRTLFRNREQRLSMSPQKLASRGHDLEKTVSTPRQLKLQPVEVLKPQRHSLPSTTPASDRVDDTVTPRISVTPAQNSNSTQKAPHNQAILKIDMRENPDIFAPAHPVNQLAQMVESGCQGHAKVVIERSDARLFVRFKLPVKYAALFPESQNFDDSCFTTTPTMGSFSPMISFPSLRAQPAAEHSPSSTVTYEAQTTHSSPVKMPRASMSGRLGGSSPFGHINADETLVVSDFANSSLATPRNTADRTLIVSDFDQQSERDEPMETATPTAPPPASPGLSILETPSISGIGVVVRDTPEAFRHSNIFAETPAMNRQTPRPAGTASPRLGFTPEAPSPGLSILDTPASGVGVIERDTPDHLRISVMSQAPTGFTPQARGHSQTTPLSRQIGRSRLSMSFTPADSTPTPFYLNTALSAEPKAETPTQPANVAELVEPTPTSQPPHDRKDDSVERVTTPRTSPVLNTSFTPVNQPSPRPAAKSEASVRPAEPSPGGGRVTSQADSFNTRRPSPEQYANEDDFNREYMLDFIKRSKRLSTTETGSPIANTSKRAPLVARSVNTDSPGKTKRKLENEEADTFSQAKEAEPAPKRAKTTRGRKPKSEEPMPMNEEKTTEEEDEDGDDGQSTRRSTRLRSLGKSARSSIPTPIKLNRPGVNNQGAVLNSAVRTEQQELTQVTRMNTRRNKGNAEYPATLIARLSESGSSSGSDQESTELASQAKGGNSPKAKATATPSAATNSGVTKPKRQTTTRQRAEKLAAEASGTPARPQRVTRSSTRAMK